MILHVSFFCVTKWEVNVKYFCLILKQAMVVSRKSTSESLWIGHLFHGTPCILERTTGTLVLPWVFGRHFLKWMIVFVANDKIHAFKWKLEFWKTCVCLHELDSFPVLRDSPDEVHGDINEHFFSMLCNEMCQQVEELCC